MLSIHSKKQMSLVIIGVLAMGTLIGIWITGIFPSTPFLHQNEIPSEITYFLVNDKGERSERRFSTGEMGKLQIGSFWVVYQKELQPLAKRIIDYLVSASQLVREHLGLELRKLGAALVVGEKPKYGSGFKEDSAIVFWVPKQSEAGEASSDKVSEMEQIYWTYTHESTESALVLSYFGSPTDVRLRWVGDGLAEYAAYLTTGAFSPATSKPHLEDLIMRVDGLMRFGEKTYDFSVFDYMKTNSEETTVVTGKITTITGFKIISGYSVSLAFWLSIAGRYGEGVSKEFLARLKAAPKPVAYETAVKILSELTGEDIGKKLQNMDLAEVRKILMDHMPK